MGTVGLRNKRLTSGFGVGAGACIVGGFGDVVVDRPYLLLPPQ
jgi:hypothetical protein